MDDETYELHGWPILECAAEGAELGSERSAVDILGDALGYGAELVVIPVSRLGAAFFDLETRIAGEFLGKFANYQVRVAIVGDIAAHVGASHALRDFVYESNRGTGVWFLAEREELDRRLGSGAE